MSRTVPGTEGRGGSSPCLAERANAQGRRTKRRSFTRRFGRPSGPGTCHLCNFTNLREMRSSTTEQKQ